MEDFDAGKSNGVGNTVKPPYSPQSGSGIKFLACDSEMYRELQQMIISELANAVTGAGLTLDAEDDGQLSKAIKAQSVYVQNIQTIASGSSTAVALTTVDLSGSPFNVPAKASIVFLKTDVDSLGTNTNISIDIGHKLVTQFEAVKVFQAQGTAHNFGYPQLPSDATTNGRKISYEVFDSLTSGSHLIQLLGYM